MSSDNLKGNGPETVSGLLRLEASVTSTLLQSLRWAGLLRLGAGRGFQDAVAVRKSSSHLASAASAADLTRNGPNFGPFMGDRSAHHCPCSSGSTWLTRRIDTDPREAKSTASLYTQRMPP